MAKINEFQMAVTVPLEQIHQKFLSFFNIAYDRFLDQGNLMAAGSMLFSLAVYRLHYMNQMQHSSTEWVTSEKTERINNYHTNKQKIQDNVLLWINSVVTAGDIVKFQELGNEIKTISHSSKKFVFTPEQWENMTDLQKNMF